MKKSLIALGIIAGMTGVAQAENTTVLYGSLGYSVGFDGVIEADDSIGKKATGVFDSFKDNSWDLKTTTAKFGIKGTEDLAAGMQALFHFEFGVDNSAGVNSTKKAFLGFGGDFGKVTLGKQGTVWGDAVGVNDTFNELTPGNSKYDFETVKLTKSVKYATPDMSGVKVTGAIQLDGANPASDGVDSYELTAAYGAKDADGIFVGAAYQNRYDVDALGNSNGTSEAMGASAGYQNSTFQAGAGYQHRASVGDRFDVGGQYFMGDNTFRAGVAYHDFKNSVPLSDRLEASLGYQHNFSKRTYSWVEGRYTNEDDSKLDDGYQVVVGVRHDF